MTIRSEWMTVLTLTALAAYVLAAPRPAQAPGGRASLAAAGIDHTPIGSVRAAERRKAAFRP